LTEKQLENRLVKWCKAQEIECFKGTGHVGIPDRFFHLPYGGTIYVELKGTSSYGLRPMQVWWRDMLRKSNPHRYFLVDDEETLKRLFLVCEALMECGKEVIMFERKLIEKYIGEKKKTMI
jgi:hypothetical protein